MRKAGLLPYGLVLAADFYLLPLCMRNTGSAMLLLLCVMPLTAFAVGVLCGVRRGFCPLLQQYFCFCLPFSCTTIRPPGHTAWFSGELSWQGTELAGYFTENGREIYGKLGRPFAGNQRRTCAFRHRSFSRY